MHGEKAKYKKLLANWFAAVCIVFSLHFLISLTVTATQAVTDVFAKSVVGPEGEDQIITEVRNEIEENVDDGEFWDAAFYIVEYLVLFIYTVTFAIQYLKRVVYVGFLILVSPMIAFTYPLDKVKDSKAQAFEFWLKEFIFNSLIQPIHLLLYFMLIKSAGDLPTTNRIYGIVAMGALLPAEKFIRKMFGLESKTSMGKMASSLGGAAIMNTINKLGSKRGKKAAGGRGAQNSTTRVRTANEGAPDLYDALRTTGGPTPTPVPSPNPGPNPSPNPSPNPGPNPSPNPGPNPSPNPEPNPEPNPNPGPMPPLRPTPPAIKNKPSTIRGVWKVAKTGGIKAAKAMPRRALKAAGAVTFGTVGLAAGIATGEIENAFAGAIGGMVAGKRVVGSVYDGAIRQAKDIGQKFGEGKYGKEEYARKQFDKQFKKSEEYKNLADTYNESDIQEFLDVGLTDAKKIGKALENVRRGKYTLKQSIAYMKMANASDCPDEVLYDRVKFATYLSTRRIDPSNADIIRQSIIDFK